LGGVYIDLGVPEIESISVKRALLITIKLQVRSILQLRTYPMMIEKQQRRAPPLLLIHAGGEGGGASLLEEE
jgi:hypothetical protein